VSFAVPLVRLALRIALVLVVATTLVSSVATVPCAPCWEEASVTGSSNTHPVPYFWCQPGVQGCEPRPTLL